MGDRPAREGVRPVSGRSIELDFYFRGVRCRERLKLAPTPRNLNHAANLRASVLHEIALGTFDYAKRFPDSKLARKLQGASAAASDSVEKHLWDWLERVKPSLEKTTYIYYERYIRRTLVPAVGKHRLAALTKDHCRDLIASKPNVTAKRWNNVLSPLRQMLAEAAVDGLIPVSPMHGIVVRRRRTVERQDEVDPFTPAELAAIMDAADPYLRALIQFIAWTGLRTSEMMALRWEDVDLKSGELRVRAAKVGGIVKAPKTKAGRRTVELLPPARKALEIQRAMTGLIGQHVWHDLRLGAGKAWENDKQLREWHWRPLLKRAQVRYRYPYQLRHTYASMLLSAGENVMWVARQMGHGDWVITARTYARWMPQVAPDAGNKARALADQVAGAPDASSIPATGTQ